LIKDIIGSGGIFLFFAFAFYLSQDYPSEAAFYPRAICILGMILSMIVFVRSLIALRGRKESQKIMDLYSEHKKNIFKVGSTLILIVIYAAFMVRLGYVTSTALFLYVVSLIIAAEDINISLAVRNIIITVAITGVLYYLFGEIVGVYLPGGFLF